MKKKMIFWDNDFDRMFDEAVEKLEKENEKMLDKSHGMCYNNNGERKNQNPNT